MRKTLITLVLAAVAAAQEAPQDTIDLDKKEAPKDPVAPAKEAPKAAVKEEAHLATDSLDSDPVLGPGEKIITIGGQRIVVSTKKPEVPKAAPQEPVAAAEPEEEDFQESTQQDTTDAAKEKHKATFEAHFIHKTVIIPHDDKIGRSGEDAAEGSSGLLVVADGVGGWADQGVDPGFYSRHLVSGIQNLHKMTLSYSAKELLVYQNAITSKMHKGSCTATIVKITGPDTIQTANIGDSGYTLFRAQDGKVEQYFRKKEGQSAFNTPYQVGSVGDDPEAIAEEMDHTVEENDIIMLYSDGYGDNVPQSDYSSCLQRYLDKTTNRLKNYAGAADCQARKAYTFGKKKDFESPFAQAAKEAGVEHKGGKHDDISVIVAQFTQGEFKPIPPKQVENFMDDSYLYTKEDGKLPENSIYVQTYRQLQQATPISTEDEEENNKQAEAEAKEQAERKAKAIKQFAEDQKKAREEKAKTEKEEAEKKAKEIEAKKGYTINPTDTYFQTFAKKLAAEAAKKEADKIKKQEEWDADLDKIRLHHILFKHSNLENPVDRKGNKVTRTKKEAIALAKQVQQLIGDDEDFRQEALKHTECTVSGPLGDLGALTDSQLTPEIIKVVDALSYGEMARTIVDDKDGIHLMLRT